MTPVSPGRTAYAPHSQVWYMLDPNESRKFYIEKWPYIFSYCVGKARIEYVCLPDLHGVPFIFPVRIWYRMGAMVMDENIKLFKITKEVIPPMEGRKIKAIYDVQSFDRNKLTVYEEMLFKCSNSKKNA